MEFIDVKTIVSPYGENKFWFGTNYNMNIYKGCCHGCIYCDSRSECYRIEKFDVVRAKKNSTEIIRSELRKKRKTGVIGTGAMSDPYNPFEEEFELTRKALIEIDKNQFGVAIATKSSLITRDIDILEKIKEHSPVMVKVTVTTYDDDLCKIIEPNVVPSSERFQVIKKLSDRGIFCGVLLMPILPYVNDNEENIKKIVKRTAEVGGKFIFAYGFGVTLRDRQREFFYKNLSNKFLDKSLIKKYKDTYGNSYECPSPNIKKLYKVFTNECNKYGIIYNMEEIILAYKKDYYNEQITWF